MLAEEAIRLAAEAICLAAEVIPLAGEAICVCYKNNNTFFSCRAEYSLSSEEDFCNVDGGLVTQLHIGERTLTKSPQNW